MMGTEVETSECCYPSSETAESKDMGPVGDSGRETAGGPALTGAQRARIERQRLRARTLQDARLVRRSHIEGAVSAVSSVSSAAAVDSGGGFLVEAAPAAPAPAPPRAPPAPLLDPAERPACLDCQRRFAHSYLLDNFDYHVCDDCRDEEGAHSLMPRTEAKARFLLKDCDLDLRPPPLPCVRRRNPHRGAGAGAGDMRLYLRAQLEARAALVWGSSAALEEERVARAAARGRAAAGRTARRLRALRMDVRSSLYQRAAPHHHHSYGPERLAADNDDDDDDDDMYERTCLECGHVDRYEKI